MAFDYEANVTAVKNALAGYNTTTSSPDLSSGMTIRVKTVSIDDPAVVGVKWDDLPAVFVQISGGADEFAGCGPTGPATSNATKFKEVTYDIFGLWGRDGAHSTHKDSLTELYRLAENIEGVLQKEMTLSGTAMYCQPESTSFGSGVNPDGTRVKGVLVALKAKYIFR